MDGNVRMTAVHAGTLVHPRVLAYPYIHINEERMSWKQRQRNSGLRYQDSRQMHILLPISHKMLEHVIFTEHDYTPP